MALPKGYIKLGAVGSALRDYMLQGGIDGIKRFGANPYAEKIGSGERKYSDSEQYEYWTMSDWQMGVGRVDPEKDGYLYGEVDSRVPNQLILPLAVGVSSQALFGSGGTYKGFAYSPGLSSVYSASAYTTQVVGTGGVAYLAVLVQADDGNTATLGPVWLYAEAADNAVVRVDLYSDSAGSPNASVANASLTISNDFPGPQWHKIELNLTGASITTPRWVVIRATTGSITLHGTSTLPSAMSVKTSTDGSAWSVSAFRPFFNLRIPAQTLVSPNGRPNRITKIVYSTLAAGIAVIGPMTVSGTISSYAFKISDDGFCLSGANEILNDATPTDAAVFNNRIYVAHGGSKPMYHMPFDVSSETSSGVNADQLLSFGGYLYRSINNILYYTGDGTDWTFVGAVCSLPYNINSMAGLGGDVYLGCDDGLYWLGPGDFIRGVTPWPASSENGRGMVTHAGAIYMIVNGRVWRYGQDGSFTDIWVSREEDLPANRLGKVIALAASDISVHALVQETAPVGRSSVWSYQDTGWHFVATLPTTAAVTMYYARDTRGLFIGSNTGQLFWLRLPAFALNPYNDPASTYMPAGWIEWGWFDGRIVQRDKDYNAISLFGEKIASATSIKVYWKDDDSTTWELLGTATADVTKLAWNNFATRPATKRFKLGLLFQTTDIDATPRLQGTAVEFLGNVLDRYGWQLNIEVLDSLEGLDGDLLDTYTVAQQLTHLDALEQQPMPFSFTDPLGITYQVRLVRANHDYVEYENLLDGTTKTTGMVYHWTVEESDS